MGPFLLMCVLVPVQIALQVLTAIAQLSPSDSVASSTTALRVRVAVGMEVGKYGSCMLHLSMPALVFKAMPHSPNTVKR